MSVSGALNSLQDYLSRAAQTYAEINTTGQIFRGLGSLVQNNFEPMPFDDLPSGPSLGLMSPISRQQKKPTPTKMPSFSRFEEGGEVEQTMTPEEQYGVIRAPDSPLMAKAAMMFRDVERRVEGSPAEFLLPGGGIATVLERKAYGEDPSLFEYGMAALDTADFVPGLGKMAIFAGAASTSGMKKIRELIEREQAGQTPEQIFAETDTFRSPIHGRPQFEIDPSNASLKENSAFSNANTPVRSIRRRQTKQERLDETDPIQYPGLYRGLIRDIQKEKELFGDVVPVGGVVDETKFYGNYMGPHKFSAENKGPLTLSEIVDFPELFQEYPQARNIRVENLPPHKGYGMFDPVTETIYIRAGDKEDVLPVLMHEVQHWVQNHEGFPFGDSPDAIPKDLKKRREARVQRINNLKSKLQDIIRPNIESAMRVKAITSGLRGAEVPEKALEREVEFASANLFSLYKNLSKETPEPTTQDLIEYAQKHGYGELSDIIKDAPGGPEAFFDLAAPFMRRFNAEAEEAFELAYAERLAREKANKQYSSTAGEIEARIVEDTTSTGNRPAPSQRLQEELEKSEIDEIRFAERFPPTSEIFDDFGNVRVPEQKAAGGGVGSLAPIARNMYKIPSVKRGVGSYISHMRR